MVSLPGRRAAIDIGSNSIKLLILQLNHAGGYEILHDECRVTRLGRGVAAGGGLHPESVADSLSCLRDYLAIVQAQGAELAATVATAALRETPDAAEFLARIARETGVTSARVISGAEEARLSRSVACRELPAGYQDVVFFDVGGGSTEITWCRNGEVREDCSLALGARRCTEQAEVFHPVSPLMHERVVAMVQNPVHAAPEPLEPIAGGLLLAGLGGTATTMLWLLRGLRGEPRGVAHLAEVSLAEIDGLLATLRSRTMTELRGMVNLDPARADVIYAGIVIIAEILRHYGAAGFLLVDRGLRYGLLLT